MTPVNDDTATRSRGRALLVAVLAALIGLPLVGSLLRSGDMPPDFLLFPLPRETVAKPGLSPFYLICGVLVALLICAFLAFPRWFGFAADRSPKPQRTAGRLPVWFWFGAALNSSSWWAMWFGPTVLANYGFVPLWWGFIIATDGVVYARTGGHSLLSRAPRQMIALSLFSIPAWTLFEYVNYFALGFWIYPSTEIFSPLKQALWYLLSFSTVWPTEFEWFSLLSTWVWLRRRWASGPAITPSRGQGYAIGALGFVLLVLFAVFPFQLFFMMWLAPTVVLLSALWALGFWTPLEPIKRGDWSLVMLAGLSSLINGCFWELWNYGTAAFRDPKLSNPNYWQYRIPYVDVPPRVFSEMPVLGYFGYIPFGILVWALWLVAAHLFNWKPDFHLLPNEPYLPSSKKSQRASEASRS